MKQRIVIEKNGKAQIELYNDCQIKNFTTDIGFVLQYRVT